MPASSFQFLHAADLHLDSPLRGLARRGEAAGAFVEATRRALENLVDAAIAERVAFVIIAGDLYDGDWRDYATGQVFARQMGRLAQAAIRVFLVRGNHDAESVITRQLPLPDAVHSFSVRAVESVAIENLGVVLHGRGFAGRHVAENVARSYPPAVPGRLNIGVLHTSLTGRDGHDVYAPCSIEDLKQTGYDYWALGHVHQREVVAADPYIVFPGNLQGRHARETGPKGATLVRVEGGRIRAVEARTLDAARFDHATLDLADIEAPADLARAARRAIAAAREAADGRPLALRLTLAGETALHDHLHAHTEQVGEEMQALAWDAGSDVLIEKVCLATRPRRRGLSLSAIAGFDEIVAEVAADPAFRADIQRTLADLRSKAPAEALDLIGLGGADGEALAEAAIAAARDAAMTAIAVAAAAPEREA
ncbi:metallophosphoesterase family protein [Blastochloris sulfoviridis]|uniref:DNA repair exonuclease n=1 Tax=Blastochloris sulfoviridis TaxID=50712 RepID=A0A5M6I1P5_9HYPH|nr:DNA repair exonuclease [Blastochloris sulfoviridis]KAA5601797.1 DNA repair exonuclease [Blastochloris sulfoviridis]